MKIETNSEIRESSGEESSSQSEESEEEDTKPLNQYGHSMRAKSMEKHIKKRMSKMLEANQHNKAIDMLLKESQMNMEASRI